MNDRIDRRSFLRRTAGAGMLIAVSQLPAVAADKPQVFAERGRYERLSIAYAVVEIGLQKPFSVLHLSDTHLTAAYPRENKKKQELSESRTRNFGGRQEEALCDSLAWAKEHVDYVIHTGDLIDWQSEANFDLVRKYFGEGLIGCVGNHEFSPDMWLSDPEEERTEAHKDHTRQLLREAYPIDVSFQSQVVNGVNFISIDNVYGYVTPRQVERFREEAQKKLPIVLCSHVPFFTDNIRRASARFWDNTPMADIQGKRFKPNADYQIQQEDPTTRDFIAYLKQEPLLKAILTGHLHVTVEEQFSPTARQYVVGSNFLFHGREISFV